jgi:hypothetical protein
MYKLRRLTLLAAGISVLTGVLALHAAASPVSNGNRFEATFQETTVSVTNRVADLGVFQLINTGIGTVEGFGDATVTLSATQDRSVQPCGPGSSANAAVRRVVLAEGVLVIRELLDTCPTSDFGLVAWGDWEVDGAASTGIFAGARGSGEATVVIATHTATLSGKLKLANE